MAERDPIDLIKEQLNRIDGLAGLHSEHEIFQHWHAETKTILEKVFSSKSIHYQNFLALRFHEMTVKAFASPEIDKINTTRYKKDIENARNIFQGAIKELTLDRTLFKKLQTTPTTVEVLLQGEYFISAGILDPETMRAIESAFEGSGLKPIYGSSGGVKEKSLQHQIEKIRRARFGIYDPSNSEKTNTLLELGAAYGLGKKIVILCRKGGSFPEAVRFLNPIEYESLSDLTEILKKQMRNL